MFKTIFRTLRYPNFRLFFIGQGISLTGSWMQQTAMAWLVYRLTGSPFLLGFVIFASQFPTFLLSPIAGVVADHFNRQRILLTTQCLLMVQALTLAALTLTGVIRTTEIVLLGIIMGCINAFDIPARHSFVVEMVERKENLTNAISLNSLIFNLARLIGPAIAGWVIALTGEGNCFLINGLSFAAIITALIRMKVKRTNRNQAAMNIVGHVKDGIRYAVRFLPIRSLLLFLGVMSLVGSSYIILMPIYARDILHGGPQTLGLLMGSVGVGALAGTVFLAQRKAVLGLVRILSWSGLMLGVCLIMFFFSRTLWFSITLLALSGFGIVVNVSGTNILLQTIVDDDKRGRIMSLYAMSFMGTAPVGSFLAGILANVLGVLPTIIVAGVVTISAVFLFVFNMPAFKKDLYPVYQKMGIIAEGAFPEI
ncbi:MAG: MFS transporter [Candidatus Omnitrophica bacterium]|nr:MFS transporter [Candidatus Omnitrophota bacterium]